MFTIVPETIDGKYIRPYAYDDVIRASYCYLHPELETHVGFDIFSLVIKKIDPKYVDDRWLLQDFPEDMYNCVCFDKPYTFFLEK